MSVSWMVLCPSSAKPLPAGDRACHSAAKVRHFEGVGLIALWLEVGVFAPQVAASLSTRGSKLQVGLEAVGQLLLLVSA